MKSIQQTRDEFFRLMADNGFESTGTADYDGNVIFAREWTRTCQVVWYGEHTSTYRVTARTDRLYRQHRGISGRKLDEGPSVAGQYAPSDGRPDRGGADEYHA